MTVAAIQIPKWGLAMMPTVNVDAAALAVAAAVAASVAAATPSLRRKQYSWLWQPWASYLATLRVRGGYSSRWKACVGTHAAGMWVGVPHPLQPSGDG